jgi:hypothetical protein
MHAFPLCYVCKLPCLCMFARIDVSSMTIGYGVYVHVNMIQPTVVEDWVPLVAVIVLLGAIDVCVCVHVYMACLQSSQLVHTCLNYIAVGTMSVYECVCLQCGTREGSVPSKCVPRVYIHVYRIAGIFC